MIVPHPAMSRLGWRALPLAVSLACACGPGSTREAPPSTDPSSNSATDGADGGDAADPAGDGDSQCKTEPTVVDSAPGTLAVHRQLATWLASPGSEGRPQDGPSSVLARSVKANQVLLDAEGIRNLRMRDVEVSGAWHPVVRHPAARTDVENTAGVPATAEATRQHIEERAAYLAEALTAGRYVEGQAGAADEVRDRSAAAIVLGDASSLHVTTDELTIWCGPTELGLLSPARDLAFDRNRCSEVHAGELIRVLASSTDGWRFVDAGYADGWIRSEELTPPLSAGEAQTWLEPQDVAVILDDNVRASAGPVLRMGVRLPVVETNHDGLDPGSWSATVLVPTRDGLVQAHLDVNERVHLGDLPLSRESALNVAFRRLGDPYGWGGYLGGRDCSRLLLDVFATMGVRLGRNSAVQGRQGTETIALTDLGDDAKLQRIHEAASRGIVLLWMKGHIMLYLGQHTDESGTPRDYALSSISEYVVPCAADKDNTYRLDRVEVTTLDIGLGSQRRSFLQRLDTATVFAPVEGAKR